MTAEAFLTRELGIRFIDARNLITEAKLELGILGYPTKSQVEEIQVAAIKSFFTKTQSEQQAMIRLGEDLDAVKSAHHTPSSPISIGGRVPRRHSILGASSSESSGASGWEGSIRSETSGGQTRSTGWPPLGSRTREV